MTSLAIRPGGSAAVGTTPRQQMLPVKRGVSRAEEVLAHHRMDAVGADDDVGLGDAAVGERQDRAIGLVPHRDALGVQAHARRVDGAREDLVQVGAIDLVVAGAEPALERALHRQSGRASARSASCRSVWLPGSTATATMSRSMPRARIAFIAFGPSCTPAPISPSAGACS